MKKLIGKASKNWDQLWGLVSLLEVAENNSLSETTGRGVLEDGFIREPDIDYEPLVRDIEQLLYHLKIVQDVDWMGYSNSMRVEQLYDHERIRSGSLEDTITLLTGIIRAERFGSDTISITLENGVFLVSLQRLQELLKQIP
jgi:hypothetical protein